MEIDFGSPHNGETKSSVAELDFWGEASGICLLLSTRGAVDLKSRTLSITHAHSERERHTHSLSLTLSLSLTHTHAHTHTHTHTHRAMRSTYGAPPTLPNQPLRSKFVSLSAVHSCLPLCSTPPLSPGALPQHRTPPLTPVGRREGSTVS